MTKFLRRMVSLLALVLVPGMVSAQSGQLLSAAKPTTSTQLRSVITNPTGTGSLVFGTSPVLVTPTLGAATATSINGTAIPSSSVLPTLADSNVFTGIQTITQAASNAGILASTGYSLTGSNATSMVDLAGTWNTSGTPSAFKLNITNTASSVASKLVDLQIDGAPVFSVERTGTTRIGSGFTGPPQVDVEIRPTMNPGYSEIRLAPTIGGSNFLAHYYHAGVGFTELWAATGTAQYDISPKPQDGTGNALISLFRNTITSGVSTLALYSGDGTANQNTAFAGNSDSFLNAVAGKVAIGTATTSAAQLTVKAGADEVLRLVRTTPTVGLSLGYNEAGNTTAYVQNLYSGGLSSAIKFGFGTTYGSFVALSLTRDLNAAFSAGASFAASTGIGTVTPLASLHVETQLGATTNEIARFTKSVGGTAYGASIGYADSGNTTAYFYNRYSSATTAAIQLGFGTTFGSLVALTLTKDLNAAFSAGASFASSVGFGTTAPLASLHVEGQLGATTNEIARFTKTAGGTALGASIGYVDSGNTTSYFYNRYSGNLASSIQLGFGTTFGSLAPLTVYRSGSVVLNTAAVATTATDGFLYIATSPGQPTGVPTAQTGRVAIVYDTTNHQFWVYDGAWLQPKTPSAAALVTWQ